MKSKNHIKNLAVGILFSAICAIGGTLITDKVHAANTTQMSVSPMNQKIILTPGEQYSLTVNVSNAAIAEEALEYKATSTPYSVIGDDYNPDLETQSTYTQMANWITINDDTGEVEPNTHISIPITISVPRNAPAGGQYATIKICNTTGQQSGTSLNIKENMCIGSIIYASVMGETKESGDILSNNIPAFISSGNLSLTFLAQNTGNTHFDAKRTVQIFPLFSNEEIFSNEDTPDDVLIMPETTRMGSFVWKETPWFGLFKVIQKIEFAGLTSTAERIVIICPIWLLFIIIFAIILIIFWLVSKSKSRKKSKR